MGDRAIVSSRGADIERRDRTEDALRLLDERTGVAQAMRPALRYVFPGHWSFMLGEVALYCFVVLIATGTAMAINYQPSSAEVVWHGPYAPLDGVSVSHAYASALDLSFKVPGGLLLRQTHHWAALLFFVAITLHLLRITLTGAFRKPRTLNYLVGLSILAISLFEGLLGYSLLDDLLSGSGLAITYAVVLSIPGIGGWLGAQLWQGPFPGGEAFFGRLFFAHVFVLPAIIVGLLTLHLTLILRLKHTQFPGQRQREDNVIGHPMWPGYAAKALGLFAGVAALLVLLGGLVQINPIWLWGPYQPWLGESGAQPDFYLGWLIGALRMVPSFDVTIGGTTVIPNPFFGGLLFPALIFGALAAIPLLDRLLWNGDDRPHQLLQRPRDAPSRTGFIAAILAVVADTFLFGASDRLFLSAGIPYSLQLWIARVLLVVGPIAAFLVTRAVCRELAQREAGLGERHS